MNNSPEGAQGSANSKTPRTDAEHSKYEGDYYLDGMVPVDFARQLERQLAQSEERVAKLEGALAPFAALMDWADISECDKDDEAFLTGSRNAVQDICGVRTNVLTVGDLRRARALLSSKTN